MQISTQALRAFEAGSGPADEVTREPSEIDLIDIKELCRLVGGTRPVHPSTVYRMIQAGKLPRANKRLRRWRKGPVVKAIKALIEEEAA